MKKLLDYADRYIENSTWKDVAMLKFCLFSLGILAGMQIPKKDKKEAGILALAVFVLTYIPLMAKYLGIFTQLGYSISKSGTKRNTADTCF